MEELFNYIIVTDHLVPHDGGRFKPSTSSGLLIQSPANCYCTS